MKYYVMYEAGKGFLATDGGYTPDPRRAGRSAEPKNTDMEGTYCIRVTQQVHEDHKSVTLYEYPLGYRGRCPRCGVRTGIKKTPEEAMKRYSGTPCIEARYTLALYLSSYNGEPRYGPEMVLV